MELTEEQKADCKTRIEAVDKFMKDNQVDLVAYPRYVHMANGVYGAEALVQFMDIKYAKKPGDVPSPFLK